MKVLVIMYWLWFGVSVIVLGRRAVRKVLGRSTPRSATIGTDAGPALIESLAQRVHERAARAAANGVVDTECIEERSDPFPNIDVPTPAVPPARPETPDAPARTLPRPARSSSSGTRTTLADALSGIAMPSELAPLTQVPGADLVRRAVFATTSATLERVDAEMLAELERLGYDTDRVGPHASLARRGDDALALQLHLVGPQPKKGPADVNYPTAPAGSVVLDLELR